jgi:putative acetyltransferase
MIEIKPIQLHQVEEVKQIIFAVCHEIWQVTEEEIRRYDAMSDIDDVQSHYFDNSGTFLVLIDDGRVVGSGAIRRLNNDICELKRMWLLKDYRGRGLGTKMTQMLLARLYPKLSCKLRGSVGISSRYTRLFLLSSIWAILKKSEVLLDIASSLGDCGLSKWIKSS